MIDALFIYNCSLGPKRQNSHVRLTRFYSYTGRGIIEYKVNETWGRVSYDNFTKDDADTVCRQLGYSEAKNYTSRTDYMYVVSL